MKYTHYTLADLAKIKYGKNQKKVLSELGNIPIYGTGGIMGYATDALYDKPSVLIGRKGTINKVKYIEQPFWTVDTLFYTEVNENLVIPKFLYYVMSLLNLDNYNEGTTIPSLRTETLYRLEFDISSLQDQEHILYILKSLDDKIEVNSEINNNLEEQAKVNFNNLYSSISDNFIELRDICDLTSSKRVFAKDYAPNGIPFYRGGEITQKSNGQKLSNNLFISKEHYLKIKNQYGVPQNGDILITAVGTVGNSIIVDNEEFYFKDGNIIWLKNFKNSFYNYYVYDYMQSRFFKNSLQSILIGSTQTALTIVALSKIQIKLPKPSQLCKYNEYSKKIRKIINMNIKQNLLLSELRDTLLPKLMSGELDVSEIDL